MILTDNCDAGWRIDDLPFICKFSLEAKGLIFKNNPVHIKNPEKKIIMLKIVSL